MEILLHICCAPCAIYPVKVLREEGFDVRGFFYNPNIHPYSEFERRKKTLETYARLVLLPLLVEEEYDLKACLAGMIGAENRCLFCYEMRVRKLCEKALELRLKQVSTTLLYSKFQRHEDIKAIGERVCNEYGIIFVYRDFRRGWKEGVEESRRLDMYRQKYCGCIFSELETLRR